MKRFCAIAFALAAVAGLRVSCSRAADGAKVAGLQLIVTNVSPFKMTVIETAWVKPTWTPKDLHDEFARPLFGALVGIEYSGSNSVVRINSTNTAIVFEDGSAVPLKLFQLMGRKRETRASIIRNDGFVLTNFSAPAFSFGTTGTEEPIGITFYGGLISGIGSFNDPSSFRSAVFELRKPNREFTVEYHISANGWAEFGLLFVPPGTNRPSNIRLNGYNFPLLK